MKLFKLAMLTTATLLLYAPTTLAVTSNLAALLPELTKTKDQPKPKVKYRTIKVAKGFNVVNLYRSNSTNSEIIRVFVGGEKVQEIETKDSMMKVTFGKLTGWINLR